MDQNITKKMTKTFLTLHRYSGKYEFQGRGLLYQVIKLQSTRKVRLKTHQHLILEDLTFTLTTIFIVLYSI